MDRHIQNHVKSKSPSYIAGYSSYIGLAGGKLIGHNTLQSCILQGLPRHSFSVAIVAMFHGNYLSYRILGTKNPTDLKWFCSNPYLGQNRTSFEGEDGESVTGLQGSQKRVPPGPPVQGAKISFVHAQAFLACTQAGLWNAHRGEAQAKAATAQVQRRK